MEAAAALFMEYGYRSVTIDMVAERAGLTKAAVYYHYRDKAALVVATAHHVFDRARRGTEALLSRPGRLDERLAAIAAVVLALPQPFTSYDALRHEAMLELTPEAQQEMWHAEEALATLIERTFAEAAATGDITTPDPRLAAHSFLALLRVGQSRTIDGQPRFPDAQRTAAELVGMLWHGIGGRSTPSVH